MNNIYKYWLQHKCDFFRKLNVWLKENNKKLDIYETNPLGAIFSAFTYWASNFPADINPETALNLWLLENKDNELYWSGGEESNFEKWKPLLIDFGYCKKEEFETEIDKIKEIYYSIKDVDPYVGDSTIRTLLAIAFYEYEKENDTQIDYNDFIDYLLKTEPEFFKVASNNFYIDNFEDFETTYKKYKEKDNYKRFVFFIKDRIKSYINYLKENIIKKACKKLGLTYRQLGEKIGYSENAISNAARGKVSKQLEIATQLYLKTLELEKKLEKCEKLKNALKDILS